VRRLARQLCGSIADALYWIHPAQYCRQFNILQKGFGE
jgi:hypothetical protein